MYIVYNLFVTLFYLGACVTALFNVKARKFFFGRRGTYALLKRSFSPTDKVIWFHAASLGEFEQGRPVIEAMRSRYPEHKILLTFFSPSGYEVRKNYAGADCICYLPFDFSWQAARFVKLANPVAVFFIKYEFWHNTLYQVHKKQIPLYGISVIFRPGQAFFQWWGLPFRRVLRFFSAFFVQNDESAQLLEEINIKPVFLSGDTRFDRVAEIAQTAKNLPLVEAFAHGTRVIVAGSTWPADEDLLVQLINQNDTNCKYIIAPHEIHEHNIAKLVQSIHVPVCRYTLANEADVANCRVLIIDNIGMLSSVYRYGTIAYIGGGFGKGIHNILEAAAYGLPVMFGPNYTKFKEAVDLIIKNGAYNIDDFADLHSKVHLLLNNESALMLSLQACKDYVLANKGATSIILENAPVQ